MDAARVRLVETETRRKDRIKLAIAKGKHTANIPLPTQINSIKLSKFEHCSDQGPLAVFTEELTYPFGCFGKYHAVRKYTSGYDIGKDYSKKEVKSNKKPLSSKDDQMLNEKSEKTTNGLTEKASLENQYSNYDMSLTHFRLPKLKTAAIEDNTPRLEFSGKNTELPKLPAQEYIDNFRRDAAEFERSLIGIGRGKTERRLFKGKPRDLGLLPRIDERGQTLFTTTNTDKIQTKDEYFRLPQLQQKREDSSFESQSKKKRKTRNTCESKKHESKRSMSHKTAMQKEAKWCRMTFQSNVYN